MGRKMSLWTRWRQGMRELTPLQLIEAKLFGILGQIAGLLLAMGYLWTLEFRFFLVFMAFTVFIQCAEFVSNWKQYDNMRFYR
jgi:hypothetical protein